MADEKSNEAQARLYADKALECRERDLYPQFAWYVHLVSLYGTLAILDALTSGAFVPDVVLRHARELQREPGEGEADNAD